MKLWPSRKREAETPAPRYPGIVEAMDGSAAVVAMETSASEAAGDLQLIDTRPGLELRRNVNCRRDTDADGDLKLFLTAFLRVFDEVVTIMPGREANRDFVLGDQHHPVDREIVAVLRIFDDHVSRRDIRPAVFWIVGAKRELCDIDLAAF